MKTEPKFPMTLDVLVEELKNSGIEVMVYRSKVEYDERVKGADVYMTLECRALDQRSDESDDEAYSRAMKVLGL